MSPLVANAVAVTLEDDAIFGFGPWGLGDSGVEVIVPAFTTLFSNAACWEDGLDRVCYMSNHYDCSTYIYTHTH